MGEIPVGAVVYETATGAVLGEGANLRHAQTGPSGAARNSSRSGLRRRGLGTGG